MTFGNQVLLACASPVILPAWALIYAFVSWYDSRGQR